MADDTKNPPAAPQAALFAPAVSQYAILTEEAGRDKKITSYLFLITEVGSADEIVRDKDGGIVMKDQVFPIDGQGKTVTRRVASTQKVATYGGFAFNASQASPSVRRNVPASSLSPLS